MINIERCTEQYHQQGVNSTCQELPSSAACTCTECQHTWSASSNPWIHCRRQQQYYQQITGWGTATQTQQIH